MNQQLEKIVLNAGVGRLSATPNFEEKILPEVVKELAMLSGQKPAPRRAAQSISGFKLREGAIVGLKATLRGRRMMEFLAKLNAVVLPRLRDFRGLDLRSVDQGGALSIGLREQVVFPEISPEQSKVNFGLEVTIVPRTRNRQKAIELFRTLGVPLKKS